MSTEEKEITEIREESNSFTASLIYGMLIGLGMLVTSFIFGACMLYTGDTTLEGITRLRNFTVVNMTCAGLLTNLLMKMNESKIENWLTVLCTDMTTYFVVMTVAINAVY